MNHEITSDMLLNTMAEGVVVVDTSGIIQLWNPAMQEITGYTADEMIGQSAVAFRASKCQGADQLNRLIDHPDEASVSGCECELVARSGQKIPVLVNARVLRSSQQHGEVLGLLQTVTDFRPIALLRSELQRIEEKIRPEGDFHGLIGHSSRMQSLYRQILLAAESDATVLVQGESGTGKELVAGAIHSLSQRAGNPMVKVNCGALPEGLLESELFGHVKGAFTGAYQDRKGRFQMADGGTIFLDEIGEISPAMQVKLLRVIQEGTFERVGSSKTMQVDVRVISATNRNLLQEMRDGAFREDLFYRLRVFPVYVPPLRERSGDIPSLANYFVNRIAAKTGRLIQRISPEALRLLTHYCWLGNVRELENAIEYAFVVCADTVITEIDLPDELRHPELSSAICGGTPIPPVIEKNDARLQSRKILRDKVRLEALLNDCLWNKAEAGRRLGVSRTAVWKWILRHELAQRGTKKYDE